jgi:hypothetical protein
MRIETNPGESVNQVYLFLTESEVRELRDTLSGMLAVESWEDRQSWHEHVASEDLRVEVTVAWESA